MPDVIIVLGMHRSGTSAVAGALTKLGGAAPRHLMPPHAANPQGYFESVPLCRFHEELLASARTRWDDWRRFDPGWYMSPAADTHKQRAREIFEAEFGNATLPILKDPRICRFVPFWSNVLEDLEATPRIVMPIRSPLEVAHSLKKRDAMPVSKGLLLWLRHVLDAEAQTRNAPRSIFTWEQFLTDWQTTATKISSDTGLSWPSYSGHSAQEVEQFLAAGLVHNKIEHAALISHPDVHEWTLAAYEALLDLTSNPFSKPASETLDRIRRLFEQSCDVFGRVFADLEIGLRKLQEQAKTCRTEGDRLRNHHVKIRAKLAAVLSELDRLSPELGPRD